jgi:NitT/TauT family transport system substrate-binding protein
VDLWGGNPMELKVKVLVFFFSFCLWSFVFPGETSAQKIRMGYLQSDLHQLAAFVALEKGLFKKHGVDVEVAGVFKAGPEEMSAFAGKSLDVGYVGAAPATVAVANKVADVKMIAQVNLEGSGIVVHKDSLINKVDHLIGKTIAVPGYAQVQDFLLRKLLTKKNIPMEKVRIIIIKVPEMIPALQTKQIDGFVAWEPFIAKSITNQVGKVLIYSREIWPKHPCCAFVADTNFIEMHPDRVKAVLRAHIEATTFINKKENYPEIVAIGVKYTGMDDETVKLAMNNIFYEFMPSVEGELEYVTFLMQLGHIKINQAKPFVDSIIEERFLLDILKKE